MPDLGKYVEAVLSAYAVSLVLILGLVVVSLWRAGKVKKQLQDVETKAQRNG